MAVGARPLVPSRLAPGGVVHGSLRHPTTRISGYVALMKLRVIELLLMTTVPTMVLAEQGWPSTWLVFVTLVGGTLAAGGANAINMVIDRDIDALMTRTQGRPLVTGLITPRAAMTFAVGLEVLAFAVLWAGANLLAACVVIGGAAGAMPILVGWAAVTNGVSWSAALLFLVIFLWTPPHTWALAIRHADDYRAANVPMLPAVATMDVTTHRMAAYTAALVVASLALVPVADLGWIYGITAVVAGAVFLWGAIDLGRRPSLPRSMRLFAFSISYITLLFGSLTLDVLVRHGV